MKRALTVLFAVVVAGACAEPRPGDSQGTARDSAGVRVIDLPREGVGHPVVALEADTAWDPAGGLEVGLLADVAVGPEGHLFLLDGMAARIHVRGSPDGNWSSFGRTGEGPGEFSSMGALREFMITDSAVLVPDLHLQRITAFSLSGEVRGIRPYPFMAYAVDWRIHPRGGLAFRSLDEGGDALIRWEGDRVDTLYTFTPAVEEPNLLLQPWALWDLTPRGELVIGRSDRGRVERRGPGSGAPAWIAQWSMAEMPLDAEEEAHLQGLVVESVRRNSPGATSEDVAAGVASVSYPDQGPVLAGILVAPDGKIWVRLARPVLSMGMEALRIGSAAAYGGERWDVLTEDGFLRARVRVPAGFTPRQFLGPWLYGILEDDLGVQTAARVRIPWGGEAHGG